MKIYFLLKKVDGKEAGKLYIDHKTNNDEILYQVAAESWKEAKQKIKAEYLM